MTKSADAFRTISEVAELLETPAHVIRFWETRFSQLRPVKRAGGRRYFRPADVALLGGLKHLLHGEGLSIRDVQKLLKEQGVSHVMGFADTSRLFAAPEDEPAAPAAVAPAERPTPLSEAGPGSEAPALRPPPQSDAGTDTDAPAAALAEGVQGLGPAVDGPGSEPQSGPHGRVASPETVRAEAPLTPEEPSRADGTDAVTADGAQAASGSDDGAAASAPPATGATGWRKVLIYSERTSLARTGPDDGNGTDLLRTEVVEIAGEIGEMTEGTEIVPDRSPMPAPAEGFATARALRRLSGTGLSGEDRATLDMVRVRLVALARRLAEASDAGAETGPEATPGKSAF